MAGTYLPPVVITVIADDTAFLKTIAKDQAVLKAFASSGANIVLDANSTPFLDSLAKARLALLAFAKETRSARLGVDAAPFWAEIRALRTQLAAMSPLDINVEANTSAVLGQLAPRQVLPAGEDGGFPLTADEMRWQVEFLLHIGR